MFIGREQELDLLETLHGSGKFEFLVLYGRRRVGKTSLLKEFSKKHPVVFYSAQAKNDNLNLADFSKALQLHFTGNSFGTFSDWNASFTYLSSQLSNKRITLIVDEFPFIAEENPTIMSIMEHAIDHGLKDKNLFLILCGSSVSFMETEVLGSKSPLYGRSTSNLELPSFDYVQSAAFFPHYSNEEKLLSYGILGGIPCYLEAFSDTSTIVQNIAQNILRMGSFLSNETQNLLKMELREPAMYNSIFEAIATGSSRLNDISRRIGEEQTKCSKYIRTLRHMRLVDKVTPAGQKESGKKSIYQISDNFFLFWYHFIFANKSYHELLGDDASAMEIYGQLSDYMGGVFERVCTQYLRRLAKQRKLPFIPHTISRWWGSDPRTRKQCDIDILALDKTHKSAIFCECKYRNKLFDIHAYRYFMDTTKFHTKPINRSYYVFSKSGFTDAVIEQAQHDGLNLVGMDDLFHEV
jgi:AAA+ ATPase superfamily predicted ATPase